jgi:hypothetical protein
MSSHRTLKPRSYDFSSASRALRNLQQPDCHANVRGRDGMELANPGARSTVTGVGSMKTAASFRGSLGLVEPSRRLQCVLAVIGPAIGRASLATTSGCV